MSLHLTGCHVVTVCTSDVKPCRPGHLLDTHQPLKILEDSGPRHSEGGDPRRGAGGAGGHG